MKSKLSFLFFLSCLAMLATSNVSALTVIGGIFRADVAPGEQIKHEITLSIGDDEEPTEVIAGVFGYGLNPEGGRGPLDAEEDQNPYSARKFLNISPESATLSPGEPVTFVVEGTVPKDIGSGGRYAIVSMTTPPHGNGQVGIALAAFIPIILTVSDSDLVETGEITNLTVSEDHVYALFENTGNYHYKASSEAFLKDDRGNVITNATALASTSIIPKASWLSKMNFEHEASLAPGTYIVEVRVIHEDGTVLDIEEETFEV